MTTDTRTEPGKLSRYCWRIGGTVMTADGETCPECGSPNHEATEDQNACGRFVVCKTNEDHGHLCEMRASHAGACGYFDDGDCP